jgi:hypothetical protein
MPAVKAGKGSKKTDFELDAPRRAAMPCKNSLAVAISKSSCVHLMSNYADVPMEYANYMVALVHYQFEATRREYYEGLQGVSGRGEWERWLGYFLNGVSRQSEDALGRAERINRQLSAWRLEIAGSSSKTPALLLERLSANPFQTVRMAAREMGMAFTTLQRAMEKLESLSIVSEVSGGKRDRVYCAKALMEILDEPAKLSP